VSTGCVVYREENDTDWEGDTVYERPRVQNVRCTFILTGPYDAAAAADADDDDDDEDDNTSTERRNFSEFSIKTAAEIWATTNWPAECR